MRYSILLAFFLCLPLLVPAQNLTIYSGRSKALVEPIIQKFEAETGVNVRVRYGGTTQLAVALLEEGRRSPADIFWAQDAGALGAVNNQGLFSRLPASITSTVSQQYLGAGNNWVATSGRARVLAFSSTRVNASELPAGIFDLDDPRWRNRLGWAPSNGSFQSFLTALRKISGDGPTAEWLRKIRDNGVENYVNNNAIIQAIAAGEIDLGLTNHYYLYRYREANASFPVDQTFFEAGDPGNLVNVSGIGILNSSTGKDIAIRFINFLLSESTQEWFTREVFEYPVIDGVNLSLPGGNPSNVGPDVDLDDLSDLEATLRMLREAGLL